MSPVSPPSTAPSVLPGVYPARVYANNDPLGQNRLWLFIPQIYGTMPVKIWAPPVLQSASIAPVGSLVWCIFHGGDPAHPTYIPANASSYALVSPSGGDDYQNLQSAANTGAFAVAGILTTSQAITLPPGCFFTGLGNGSVIRAQAGVTIDHILGVTQTGQLNYSVYGSNLVLDGNQANGATVAHGFYGLSLNDSKLDGLRVINCSGDSITFDGSASFLGAANKVVNCFIRNGGHSGLVITSFTTDTQLTACDFGSCNTFAYYIGGHHVFLSSCIGWGSGNGMFVDTSGGHVFASSCRFDFNEGEGMILNGSVIYLDNVLALNNSFAASGAKAGIQVGAAAVDVGIVNCRSYGAFQIAQNQSYGLQLLAGHSQVNVLGGNYRGNATASITGTNASDQVTGAFT